MPQMLLKEFEQHLWHLYLNDQLQSNEKSVEKSLKIVL